MTHETLRQPALETVIEEHRRLRDLLDLIRNALDRRDRSAYRMANLLADLEVDLVSHFEHEEHGGYLQEALALAPRFARQASRLVAEHGEFLEMVREMRQATDEHDWEAVRRRFRDFVCRFGAHETDENRLVQDAMLIDIEAED